MEELPMESIWNNLGTLKTSSNPLKSVLLHSWLWNYLYLRLKFSPQLGGFVSINSSTKGWKIHSKMFLPETQNGPNAFDCP